MTSTPFVRLICDCCGVVEEHVGRPPTWGSIVVTTGTHADQKGVIGSITYPQQSSMSQQSGYGPSISQKDMCPPCVQILKEWWAA